MKFRISARRAFELGAFIFRGGDRAHNVADPNYCGSYKGPKMADRRRIWMALGAIVVVSTGFIAPATAKGGAAPATSKRPKPAPAAPIVTRIRDVSYYGTSVAARLTHADNENTGINDQQIIFTFPASASTPEQAPTAQSCTAKTARVQPPDEPTSLVAEDGWAICSLSAPDAVAAAPSRITATFYGTATYGPAQTWVSGFVCSDNAVVREATGEDGDYFCAYRT